MSDSPALRQRRRRLHKAGDHSLCGDCGAEPSPTPVDGGRVATAVASFVAGFSFPEGDPRGVLTVVAIRVAQELDKAATPGLSHELAGVLRSIAEMPGEPADDVNERQMRHHVRRLADVLGKLPGAPGA